MKDTTQKPDTTSIKSEKQKASEKLFLVDTYDNNGCHKKVLVRRKQPQH